MPKKIFNVYDTRLSGDEPLTQVEAGSEERAVKTASAYFDVPAARLYAVPVVQATKIEQERAAERRCARLRKRAKPTRK